MNEEELRNEFELRKISEWAGFVDFRRVSLSGNYASGELEIEWREFKAGAAFADRRAREECADLALGGKLSANEAEKGDFEYNNACEHISEDIRATIKDQQA
jgi:hypothetical protein